MRRVWRGAVPLLAAALGFARPASAQPSLPAADPAPAAFADLYDDAPPLPRVVPHRRVTLEPLKETSDVGPTALRPAVDLLAPSPVPPGWWSKAIPNRVLVVPSGLPNDAVSVAPASPRPAATGPVRAAAPVHPPLHSQAMTAPGARAWPAAFLVRNDGEHTETKQAAHAETVVEPVTPASATDDGPTVADVKQRIEALVGLKAADVAVESGSDGGVVVRVRVRAANSNLKKETMLQLLKAAGPGVRVFLELER